jgi:hypothetical protein
VGLITSLLALGLTFDGTFLQTSKWLCRGVLRSATMEIVEFPAIGQRIAMVVPAQMEDHDLDEGLCAPRQQATGE